jgi:hypothetical protein
MDHKSDITRVKDTFMSPIAWLQVYKNAQGQELYAFSKERNKESDIALYHEDVVMAQASRIANLETALETYKGMWNLRFSGWGQQKVTENETK